MEQSGLSDEKLRVLLVEDHAIFREQLLELINRQPDMTMAGQADNVAEALQLTQTVRPDVVVIDITLKGRSGLELLKDFKAQGVSVPALVLSMHDELLYAERVLRAGARGYITKHETSKERRLLLHLVQHDGVAQGFADLVIHVTVSPLWDFVKLLLGLCQKAALVSPLARFSTARNVVRIKSYVA